LPVVGIVGRLTSPAYSAAKGAITIFTKSAALQYAKENIRINSVHPGYADTPLTEKRFSDPAVRQPLIDRTPMGRLGTADDIANGVLFLASDEPSRKGCRYRRTSKHPESQHPSFARVRATGWSMSLRTKRWSKSARRLS